MQNIFHNILYLIQNFFEIFVFVRESPIRYFLKKGCKELMRNFLRMIIFSLVFSLKKNYWLFPLTEVYIFYNLSVTCYRAPCCFCVDLLETDRIETFHCVNSHSIPGSFSSTTLYPVYPDHCHVQHV